MSAWRISLLILVGAGIGANARYWLSTWIGQRFGPLFPWGTVTVNVSGSVLIGVIAGSMLGGGTNTHPWRILLSVALLGGYTTFSAFSLETVMLLREQRWVLAFLNVTGTTVLGVAGCWLGLLVAGAVTSPPGSP